ncbi:MAG: bifunctional prephenate dehydrogenase/3-phosphoshikimate 1-carboxyvinyltransferase, partial [Ketobacter sp.]|nr:bifunctional prephenate dehydrogenase/3-phosphoshikimate 1-carboxyvinyltransferase [Ketobacter sp.]
TEALLKAMAPALDGNTVVTDAGSVKGNVVAAARAVFGKVPPWFVPGHPIAGSERSGVEAAKADLYVNHKVILTPTPETDPEALNLVQHTWRGMGADVLCMDVAQHDAVLAATSHLPHLLAFSLVDTLSKEDENQEIFRYAAGGFRDFTRIASSDPTMWHDIFIANRLSVLDVIGHFSRGLEVFKTAVEQEDSQAILGIMTRAKVARDHFTKMLAKRAYSKTMTEKNIVFTAHAGGAVKGSIRVPGDKSISHRSIMMGSLADGVTEVFGFLEGEDSLATLQAFRDLGVTIEGPNNGHVKIYGVGMHGLLPPHGPLYLGNSGTSMRLLAGLLSAQNFDVELTGDESLSRRPMGRVTKPLAQMGAAIESQEDGTPPLKIQGGQALKGIHYDMPMASAQVKSCILLAGLYAEGAVSVTEPAPTRDHTERMLRGFGYPVTSDGNKITLIGGGGLTATTIDVPADISSATFFMVAASITPGSDLTLEHVGINPTRIGVLNILRAMGGKIEVHNEREVGGEPVADIRVQYAPLKGIHIPEDQVPLAIDEFPALFVAAACAEGTTVLTGAEELRVKESDRIQVMADGLQALGVKADATADGIVIEGGPLGGGTVESHGDHRIAMSFAVAALRAEADITINNCANVATSFPNFVELSRKVGMKLDVAEVGESHA